MKAFLILFLFITSSAWSKPVQISILFKDAITLKKVPNLYVQIKTESGMKVGAGYSDKNGRFQMKAELPSKKSRLYVNYSDSLEMYVSIDKYLYINSEGIAREEYSLVPSAKMYAEWYANDDSLYGGRNEGTDLKNSALADSGCSRANYIEASYPGGTEKMNAFIGQILQYPQESIEMDEQGTVVLEFIVEESGAVSHLKILEGVSPELNAEAYRIVKSMPNWNPGKCSGKPVRVALKIPIVFSLR